MKKLAFACALLCSLGSVDVFGMNPNQLPQAGNIAVQNNPVGENGLNIEGTNDVVNGNAEENPQQRKEAALCGVTSAFFNVTSLLLATAASYGVYQNKVSPADNLKRMTKTIAAFIGTGAGIEALLSRTPLTYFGCVGCGISSLLSFTMPAMEIVFARHRENSIDTGHFIDSLALFLVESLCICYTRWN